MASLDLLQTCALIWEVSIAEKKMLQIICSEILSKRRWDGYKSWLLSPVLRTPYPYPDKRCGKTFARAAVHENDNANGIMILGSGIPPYFGSLTHHKSHTPQLHMLLQRRRLTKTRCLPQR